MLLATALLLLAGTATSALAQESEQPLKPEENVKISYVEFNFGAAFITSAESEGEEGEGIFPFPGLSFLWGKSVPLNDSYFIDVQMGIALPTLVTGKIGVGRSFKGHRFTAGIRPFPAHLYIQTEITSSKRGSWILSVEGSPFAIARTEPWQTVSFFSTGIITIGKRWNLGSKK